MVSYRRSNCRELKSITIICITILAVTIVVIPVITVLYIRCSQTRVESPTSTDTLNSILTDGVHDEIEHGNLLLVTQDTTATTANTKQLMTEDHGARIHQIVQVTKTDPNMMVMAKKHTFDSYLPTIEDFRATRRSLNIDTVRNDNFNSNIPVNMVPPIPNLDELTAINYRYPDNHKMYDNNNEKLGDIVNNGLYQINNGYKRIQPLILLGVA